MTTTTDYADILANKIKEEAARTKEILDRTRRIETKLTSWLEGQGVDTESDPVVWAEGVVTIPSLATSMRDVLASIPRGAQGAFVHHKGKRIAFVEPL